MKFQFENTEMKKVAIPARIVDQMLSATTGGQLKVLLFLLRFDQLAHTSEEIASHCGMTAKEVEEAVSYWVREQILINEQGRLRLVSGTKTVLPRELPRVQPSTILEEASPDFQGMLKEIERLVGKPLNSLMASLFYNMQENLGFTPEMIVQLAAYCNSIDKFSYRYMETVAVDWYDEGIQSFEQAEAKIGSLEQSRALERRLQKAFGIATAFSKKQKEQIGEWLEKGLTEELILEAYNRCMDNKGQMSFPYMNKILQNWSEQGIQKVAEIKEEPALRTGRQEHKGLSELEKLVIGKMQGGEEG
ncbi:MAG: DnaD domain protein [Clostridia bacterium]|nr:DnaD domain protein [Clostridia bacterium]